MKSILTIIVSILLLLSVLSCDQDILEETSEQPQDTQTTQQKTLDDKFSLSLVSIPSAEGESEEFIMGGDGHLIVLINNREAKDPTWGELENFLNDDKIDLYPYNDLLLNLSPFRIISGDPWDSVEIEYYKNWAEYDSETETQHVTDFIVTAPPREDRIYALVCADYAEIVHNNAEVLGIRSAYVTITFEDGLDHALNAFNTVDRGLLFIDSTGESVSTTEFGSNTLVDKLLSGGWDKIAHVETGEMLALSPVRGNGEWEPLGVVEQVYIQWD
jgi:hypothetical protein